MNIIYEDSKKLIVYKPSGVLTQSAKGFDADLVSQVLTYRRSKGEAAYAAVINRLDRPVSGLVLFAKDKKEAARLSAQLQNDSLNKQYYALICGKPEMKKGSLVDYLLKDGRNNISAIVDKETNGAKRAELEYEVIKSIKAAEIMQENAGNYVSELTLVRIHLITGRHHQIRVQFAGRGLPLLGDTKYGGEREKNVRELLKNAGKKITAEKETALCAYSITVDGKTYEVPYTWKLPLGSLPDGINT